MKRVFALSVLATLAIAPSAHADVDDWSELPSHIESPENFGLELRIGMYNPIGLGDSFSDAFSDLGPMLALEFHYFPFRVRYLGMFGVGGGLGWSQWERQAPATAGGAENGERETFEMIPLVAGIVWRWDTLARELHIPLVLTPKVFFEAISWQSGSGGSTRADGWAYGPRFAGKVSLELDFLEPRAARQLDEEWGVNHSEIFFEMYYSMAGSLLDRQLDISGWGWSAGLALTF